MPPTGMDVASCRVHRFLSYDTLGHVSYFNWRTTCPI